ELAALLGRARLPRAVARLGPAVDRLDARQVVVPVAGVDSLAATVRGATREIGGIDRRPFRGHLTVARTKRDARTAPVGVPVAACPPLARSPPAAAGCPAAAGPAWAAAAPRRPAVTSPPSSGVVPGANRCTTLPSPSTRNFSKFHVMSACSPSPGWAAFSIE